MASGAQLRARSSDNTRASNNGDDDASLTNVNARANSSLLLQTGVLLFNFFSAVCLIFVNKRVLSAAGFGFPVVLTVIHYAVTLAGILLLQVRVAANE
jgi:hypothetical protein